jgi:hypothetical protein
MARHTREPVHKPSKSALSVSQIPGIRHGLPQINRLLATCGIVPPWGTVSVIL